MKLTSIVGTRPQLIKLNMILKSLPYFPEIKHNWIHTGQHYSRKLSGVFEETFHLPKAAANLKMGEGTSGDPIKQSSIMMDISEALARLQPDAVLIYGDCNTSLFGAQAAMFMGIPIYHIEAGCRCGSWKVPEERNRVLIDKMSSLLFCPTKKSMSNLILEGIEGNKFAFFTGDVMYDSFLYYQYYLDNIGTSLEFDFDVLLTVHRQENDTVEKLTTIFKRVEEDKRKFFFPCHPRTKNTINNNNLQIPKNVTLNDPVNYFENLLLLKKAKEVWTDSGGLIREAKFSHLPVVNLREETEWEDLLYWNGLEPIPCGDGMAARKILEIILNLRPPAHRQ